MARQELDCASEHYFKIKVASEALLGDDKEDARRMAKHNFERRVRVLERLLESVFACKGGEAEHGDDGTKCALVIIGLPVSLTPKDEHELPIHGAPMPGMSKMQY